ncbi:MAG: pre-toxin TG domain-containing protein [Patescibacteria group bacterium]|mgnify:CR=1 FL=1
MFKKENQIFDVARLVWKRSAATGGSSGSSTHNPEVLEINDDSPTPVDIKREKTPEDLAEAKEARAMQIRSKNANARVSELALERLTMEEKKRQFDPETPHLINSINFEESAEKQRKRFDAAETVLVIMLSHMIAKGLIQPDELDSVQSVKSWSTKLPSLEPKPGIAERALVRKMHESLENEGSDFYKELDAEWINIVSKAASFGPHIKEVLEAEFQLHEEIDKQNDPWYVTFFKTHPKLAIAGAIAGATGAFFMVRGALRWLGEKFGGEQSASDASNAPKEETSGFWSKTKWILGGILTFFGVGKMLGLEGVSEYLTKHGVPMDSNKILQVWTTISRNPFSLANWKTALEIVLGTLDQHKEMHAEVAEIANKEIENTALTGSLIAQFGKEDYQSFISGKSAVLEFTKKTASGIASAMGLSEGVLDFIGLNENSHKQAMKFQKFLEGRKDQIAQLTLPANATVDTVLFELKKAGYLGDKPLPKNEAGRTPQSKEDMKVTVSGSAERTDLIPLLPPAIGAMAREIEHEFHTSLMPADEAKKILDVFEEKKKDLEKSLTKARTSEEQESRREKLEEFNELFAKFAELYRTREAALGIYTKSLKEHADIDVIAGNANAIFDINSEMVGVAHDLTQRELWKVFAGLAVTQGNRFAYAVKEIVGKPTKRDFVFHLITRLFSGKTQESLNAIRSFSDKAEEIAALQAREQMVDKHIANIKAEYDEVRIKIKNSENLTTKDSEALSKYQWFKQEKKALAQRQVVADLERRLSLPATTAAQKTALSAQIEVEQKTLDVIDRKLLQRQQRAIRKEFEFETDTMSHTGKIDFDRETEMFERMKGHEKALNRRFTDKMELLKKAAPSSPEAKTIMAEIQEIAKMKQDLWFQTTKSLDSLAVRIFPTRFNEHVVLQYRRVYKKVMEGMTAKVPGISAAKAVNAKGKLIFYGLTIAGGTALGRDEFTDAWTAGKQAALDVAPVTGTFSDFYSMTTGKEYITGRKLDATERFIRGGFGAVGALSDVLLVVGVGVGIRGALTTVKLMRKSRDAIRIAKVIEEARAAKTLAEQTKIMGKVAKIEKSARTIALAGTGALMGYQLVYQPIAELNMSKEMKELVGDMTTKIEDVDLSKIPSVGTVAKGALEGAGNAMKQAA